MLVAVSWIEKKHGNKKVHSPGHGVSRSLPQWLFGPQPGHIAFHHVTVLDTMELWWTIELSMYQYIYMCVYIHIYIYIHHRYIVYYIYYIYNYNYICTKTFGHGEVACGGFKISRSYCFLYPRLSWSPLSSKLRPVLHARIWFRHSHLQWKSEKNISSSLWYWIDYIYIYAYMYTHI